VTAAASVKPPRIAGARSRLNRTPVRLRLTAAVLAIAAIALGIVAATAATNRRDAARSVAASSEPQLRLAEALYASLSDADATAATTFLTGGIESAASRRQYLRDLDAAGAQLDTLARRAGHAADTRTATATLARQLPAYTGLVEAARANNRQGFPVGAAYLRRASGLMRDQLLPAAEHLYVVAARRMNADYRDGTRDAGLTAALAGAVVVFLLVVLAQIGVGRFSHRVLNVPLLIATVLVAGLGLWIGFGLTGEQSALSAAQRKGSDSVQLLSASRVLALRAQGDDSLVLIGRGSDTKSGPDYETAMTTLRGKQLGRGLLGEAQRAAERAGTPGALTGVRASLAGFARAHAQVAARVAAGQYTGAVGTYIRSELPQARRLNGSLERGALGAQARFATNADSANAAVGGLQLGIPLLTLAIAVLAVLGLSYRLKEYR
jgi:hypothetical protein